MYVRATLSVLYLALAKYFALTVHIAYIYVMFQHITGPVFVFSDRYIRIDF